MKKALLLILTFALIFSLAACGGKNGGNDDPLNRPGNTSGPNSTAGGNPDDIPNLADAIGGTGRLSDLNAAERQIMIDAAREEGADVNFKSDGSVVITEADGNKSTQHPDGTWTFEDADGSKHDVQIGGEWPDNEFTKLLPKPEFFSLNGAVTEEDGFSVSFAGATLEQTKAYVTQVKAKGFDKDEDLMDEKYGDMVVYSFSANNGSGYRVEITFTSGQTVLSIVKD